MSPAEDLFREGRAAVCERATAMIAGDTLDVEVARYRRRRLLRRPVEHPGGGLPANRAEALRGAAALVLANESLLDAATANDRALLDRRAEQIELELEQQGPAEILDRFAHGSTRLLDRLVAEPDLVVEHVYPVARTASDLVAFVAAELHLIARMLDPAYEPADPQALLRTLNQSLRSMIGHGLEDWVSERVKPWRNMVIRRGLAWP